MNSSSVKISDSRQRLNVNKQNLPLITVITVVLNDEQKIEKTIKSILNQTYKNIEYIIIDGDSSDGTLDVLKKFENRISLIISETDKGVFDAMNKGVKFSKGEYINFLNSGDVHDVNFFQKVFLDKYRPEVDFYHSKMKLVKNDLVVGSASPVLDKKKLFLHMGSPILHPTLIVKKKLFDQLGSFDIRYSYAADHDWILKMLSTDTIGIYSGYDLTSFDISGISSNEKAIMESYHIIRGNKNYKLCVAYKLAERLIKYYTKKMKSFFSANDQG